MMNRREFLGTAAVSASGGVLAAQAASPWGAPVIDIHHHPRASPEEDFRHLDSVGIGRANILAGTRVGRVAALKKSRPNSFIHFGGADVAQPDGLDKLRKIVADGAHGFGEIKLHLPLDSKPMRNLYAFRFAGRA